MGSSSKSSSTQTQQTSTTNFAPDRLIEIGGDAAGGTFEGDTLAGGNLGVVRTGFARDIDGTVLFESTDQGAIEGAVGIARNAAATVNQAIEANEGVGLQALGLSAHLSDALLANNRETRELTESIIDGTEAAFSGFRQDVARAYENAQVDSGERDQQLLYAVVGVAALAIFLAVK